MRFFNCAFYCTLSPPNNKALLTQFKLLNWLLFPSLMVSTAFILQIAACVFCVVIAGIVSGLTLTIFSLDKAYLTVLASSGESNSGRAKRLLPLVERPHWVLCTLIIVNASVMESLPLLTNSLVTNPIISVAVSTVVLMVCSEILPQSCFVRFAIPVGSFFAYFVWFLMAVTAILSWPLSKLMDVIVGHKGMHYLRRFEMREFIQMQALAVEQTKELDDEEEASPRGTLTAVEIKVMLGALSLSERTVADIMKTKLENVFMLSEETWLTKKVVEEIFTVGYSRIPLFSGKRENIKMFLVVKSLLKYIFEEESSAPLATQCQTVTPLFINAKERLVVLYDKFQRPGAPQLAVVVDDANCALGIVTGEDVIEQVQQVSFKDETDLEAAEPVQMMLRDWQQRRRVSGAGDSFAGPRSMSQRKSQALRAPNASTSARLAAPTTATPLRRSTSTINRKKEASPGTTYGSTHTDAEVGYSSSPLLR